MASASGQPLPDYPNVPNPGMENWTQGPGGQWTQKLPGGVTGMAIDYAPNMRLPGFTPGGPDDPANGGTGYYNGGNPPVQNHGMLMPKGPIDGVISGGGGGLRPAPPVQNPGMPTPGGNPQGWYDRGGPGNPGTPVQNPGMPMPGGPGTPIDNGPVMKPVPGGRLADGLQKGTLGGVRDFIQAGKMGRAKQAFEAGGGKWNSDVARRLRKKYG